MIRQFLIIDADDTLWENNIYFERAFEEFVAFLGHSSLTPEIRDILDEIEAANARIHGYGSLNFGRNLRQCYRAPGGARACSEDDLKTVMAFRRADSGVPHGGDRRAWRKRWSTWPAATI